MLPKYVKAGMKIKSEIEEATDRLSSTDVVTILLG